MPTFHTARRDDRGSIVVGWLVKLVVTLALLGTVLFDAASVGVAHLNATDDAGSAASAAAQEYHLTHSADQALLAAQNSVSNVDEEIVPGSMTIAPDGTVQLKLRRKATTLLMYRIGPLKKYTEVVVVGVGGPSS